MSNIRTAAVLAIALTLLACGSNETPNEEINAVAPTAPSPQASPPPRGPQPEPVANGTDDGIPDLSPPELTSEAERGETGARNVLLSFARAIELKEFGQAWSLLSPSDKEKWSKADFAAIFSDLGKSTVAVPSGTMEGAAGSLYYTAPVTITGTDRGGRPVRIEGEAVLRRVNGVDGATPDQLRWHFEKLTLDWTH